MLKPKPKFTKKEMKKDPLLETINTGYKRYNEHKSMIFRAGIGIIALIVIIVFLSTRQGSQQKPADILLGNALVSMDTGDIENAQFQFERLSNDHASTNSGRLSSYFLGYLLFNDEEHESAKAHLSRFVSRSSDDKFLASAHVMLSNIHQEQNDQQKETEHLELAVKYSANEDNKYSIELMLAEHYAKIGQKEKALSMIQNMQELDDLSTNDKKKAEELRGTYFSL